MLQEQERQYVRELARKAAELAASDEYELRRRRWRDVNGLRRPDRPPVYCRPVGCWQELLAPGDLRCRDPLLRSAEAKLRQALIKHDIGDDSLIDPFWPVPAAFELEGDHTWGVPIGRTRPQSAGGSWKYDPPVRDESDLAALRMPSYRHDERETARRLERHAELFEGIMPVKLVAAPPLNINLATHVTELVGMEGLLMGLALRPRMVHRLMGFLSEGVMRALDWAEATGLLSENNNEELFCSDSLKASGPEGPVRIGDLWASANSQEFDAVSPAMTSEFLLDYYKPILHRHGLAAFGCCENLTHKIQDVLTIRNLRIFVCSAWTDLDKVIGLVGDRYTIMWRQKATDVVYAPDVQTIRRGLDEGLRRTRGLYRQVVLRELQTLRGNLRRLHEWAAAAIESAWKHN